MYGDQPARILDSSPLVDDAHARPLPSTSNKLIIPPPTEFHPSVDERMDLKPRPFVRFIRALPKSYTRDLY